ncbi:MAG: antibiotic biosynthesis monooxygenase family protein [Gammaproteobacteria bacterium]
MPEERSTETPEPTSEGDYVVVFASSRTADDDAGYALMASKMAQLAAAAPGFVRMRSTRGADGVGITVCYWRSAEAIADWKQNIEHMAARELGRSRWYTDYDVTVARVVRHYTGGVR